MTEPTVRHSKNEMTTKNKKPKAKQTSTSCHLLQSGPMVRVRNRVCSRTIMRPYLGRVRSIYRYTGLSLSLSSKVADVELMGKVSASIRF